jgi:hypothetical protein
MKKSYRVWGYAGATLFLILVLFACAAEPSSNKKVLDLTDWEETSTGRATATLVRVTPTPQTNKAVPVTLVIETPVPGPIIVEEEAKMMPTVSVSPGLQGFVSQAMADLAERLEVGVEQIEVVEAKAVVWPDGGLGCSQPGVVYTQVQREGALIRLRVENRVYNYHSGGGALFLCERPIKYDDLAPSPGLGIE